jgi:hypothetical protein
MFCTFLAEETLRIRFTILLIREEVLAVCSGNNTKSINIFSGKIHGFLLLKQTVYIVTAEGLMHKEISL